MSDPNVTMDKVPVPIVKMLGEIHEKVNAINTKADRALEKQRAAQDEMKCMRETWEQFHATYGEYLAVELRRMSAREKLRAAIIEKSLVAAVCAVGVFVMVAVWQYLQDSMIERNRRNIEHNSRIIEQMKGEK